MPPMQDWLALYEDWKAHIHDSPQSWWDEEAPLDKTDVGVVVDLLDDLEKDLGLVQGVDTVGWAPSEIEWYVHKLNKSAKELVSSYDDDQIQFVRDYLNGKYA